MGFELKLISLNCASGICYCYDCREILCFLYASLLSSTKLRVVSDSTIKKLLQELMKTQILNAVIIL